MLNDNNPHSSKKRYLGDGVYASFDGFQVWLSLDAQGPGKIEIALEPNVIGNLISYIDDVYRRENK